MRSLTTSGKAYMASSSSACAIPSTSNCSVMPSVKKQCNIIRLSSKEMCKISVRCHTQYIQLMSSQYHVLCLYIVCTATADALQPCIEPISVSAHSRRAIPLVKKSVDWATKNVLTASNH